MRNWSVLIVTAVVSTAVMIGFSGCSGHPEEQKAISQIQTILRVWKGDYHSLENAIEWGDDFKDPWGKKYIVEASQTDTYSKAIQLEVRSCGPDNMPYNSDDIVAKKIINHIEKEKFEKMIKLCQ